MFSLFVLKYYCRDCTIISIVRLCNRRSFCFISIPFPLILASGRRQKTAPVADWGCIILSQPICHLSSCRSASIKGPFVLFRPKYFPIIKMLMRFLIDIGFLFIFIDLWAGKSKSAKITIICLFI